MVLRIFKIIATIGFLAALECTKFVFGRGSAPDPTGELTALPRQCSWFKGHTSNGEGREAEEKGREDGDRKGTGGTVPPIRKFFIPPLASEGPSPRLPTGALPQDPTGDFRLPDPLAPFPFTQFLIHLLRTSYILKYWICRW